MLVPTIIGWKKASPHGGSHKPNRFTTRSCRAVETPKEARHSAIKNALLTCCLRLLAGSPVIGQRGEKGSDIGTALHLSPSRVIRMTLCRQDATRTIERILDMRPSDDRGECAGPDQTDIPGSDRKDSPGQQMLVSRADKSVSDADAASDRAAKLGRNRAQRCDEREHPQCWWGAFGEQMPGQHDACEEIGRRNEVSAVPQPRAVEPDELALTTPEAP